DHGRGRGVVVLHVERELGGFTGLDGGAAGRLGRDDDRRPQAYRIGGGVISGVGVSAAGNRGRIGEVVLNVDGNIHGQRDRWIAAPRRQSVGARAGKRRQRAAPPGSAQGGWNRRVLHVGQGINHGHCADGRPKSNVADRDGVLRAGLGAVEGAAVGLGDRYIRRQNVYRG